jgi:hypothetical protein
MPGEVGSAQKIGHGIGQEHRHRVIKLSEK